ncbi:MAG: MlaD family protein [Acidaminococcaceae bacterium]|nr:MlaD family protein [Acidaminococcaceae bacterium]
MKGTSEVKVGAVALGALAIFLAIISFLGTFSFAGGGYGMSVIYDQVGGLKEGHVVRYAGVDVGTVRAVNVEGNKVEASLKIREGIRIPQGSQFSIGADGMLGEKFVAISPPSVLTGSYIGVGEKVKGSQGAGLDEFMAASGKVLEKLEGIADALNNVLGDKEVQQSMRDGFMNARDISANLNTFSRVMAEVAADNQKEISVMIVQLSRMAERMNNVATHLDSILAGADNDGQTGRDLAAMSQNLARASERVEKMTATLEKVVTDPKTESDLRATIKNAKETSEKANKVLTTLESSRFQAEALYSDKRGDWLNNMGVTLRPSGNGFVYLGADDIGDGSKLNLQFGRDVDDFAFRLGSMRGKFGVGVDYRLSSSFKVYTDVYDFDETKVKVGGEYMFNPKISLVGESLDVTGHGSENAYVGVRTYF